MDAASLLSELLDQDVTLTTKTVAHRVLSSASAPASISSLAHTQNLLTETLAGAAASSASLAPWYVAATAQGVALTRDPTGQLYGVRKKFTGEDEASNHRNELKALVGCLDDWRDKWATNEVELMRVLRNEARGGEPPTVGPAPFGPSSSAAAPGAVKSPNPTASSSASAAPPPAKADSAKLKSFFANAPARPAEPARAEAAPSPKRFKAAEAPAPARDEKKKQEEEEELESENELVFDDPPPALPAAPPQQATQAKPRNLVLSEDEDSEEEEEEGGAKRKQRAATTMTPEEKALRQEEKKRRRLEEKRTREEAALLRAHEEEVEKKREFIKTALRGEVAPSSSASPEKKARRTRRVLTSKTFLDEEGFEVTRDVWEEVSIHGDEMEEEAKPRAPPPPPVVAPVKSEPAAAKATGKPQQKSLFGFFSKAAPSS